MVLGSPGGWGVWAGAAWMVAAGGTLWEESTPWRRRGGEVSLGVHGTGAGAGGGGGAAGEEAEGETEGEGEGASWGGGGGGDRGRWMAMDANSSGFEIQRVWTPDPRATVALLRQQAAVWRQGRPKKRETTMKLKVAATTA
ncbi:hypothetical protein NL676_026799 [Syzygium grande]|nr:hypothetical protein NL676_026799 [Syzygium grande]